MKTFKTFLTEARIIDPHNYIGSYVSLPKYAGLKDEDVYGKQFEGTPEEFESLVKKHIEDIESKKGSNKPAIVRGNLSSSWSEYSGARNNLHYHLTSPNLTDEHWHRAIPHLLNRHFYETVGNLDIPFHVLQPHAELLLISNPNKDMNEMLTYRERREYVERLKREREIKKNEQQH
jgi:hypothetical protein